MSVDFDLVNRVRVAVGEELARGMSNGTSSKNRELGLVDEQALARELIVNQLKLHDQELLNNSQDRLNKDEEQELAETVYHSLYGLGKIQTYINDPNIQDIHINGYDVVWAVLRDGTKKQMEPVATSDEELITIIAGAARRLGRIETRFDFANPTLDLQLPNGDRLHALMTVARRPMISIRSHDFELSNLKDMIEVGLLDQKIFEFLSAAVKSRQNIIVAGGTGVGKTTMLRCLINEIPSIERLITIEESLEIGLHRFADQHPNSGELEARSANIEGRGMIDIADLTREALRMDPGRVIVGEVRGREVLPMLLAMSQGNDGSMCTIHADSAEGVFGRLQMYAAMTAESLEPHVTNLLVANAVDFVVHVGWGNKEDGTPIRRLKTILQVIGCEGVNVISNKIFAQSGGGWGTPTGGSLTEEAFEKMKTIGYNFEQ